MSRPLDLRRNGSWIGTIETAELGPLPGALRELEDAVVSEDGRDLIPAPGLRLVAKPFHGQAFTVSNVSVSGVTTITVDASADRGTSAWMPTSFKVYIPVDALEASQGIYTATRTGANTFTIATTSSNVAISDSVLIGRAHRVHAIGTVDRRLAIAVETTTSRTGSGDSRNVAVTVCTGTPSTAASITQPVEPAVASATDEGCILWPAPSLYALNNAEYGADNSLSERVRHFDILGRMVMAVQNGRVVLAVPGRGYLYQANVRAHFQTIALRPPTYSGWPNTRFTKMLGIPRVSLDYDALTLTSLGTGLTTDRWYTVAVGLRDPVTGEVGLISQPKALKAVAPDLSIDVEVRYPRAFCMDCVGLQLVLYASEPYDDGALTGDDAELAALAQPLFPVAFQGPFATSGELSLFDASLAVASYTFVLNFDPDPAAQVAPRRVPVIELPPPGASWVAFVRSRLLCGGERPAYWDFPAWPRARDVLGAPSGTLNLNYQLIPVSEQVGVSQTDASAPMPMGRIPTSYNGRIVLEIGDYDASGVITIGTANTNNIGRNIGQDNCLHSGAGPQAYKVEFRAGNTTSFITDNLRRYRILTPEDLVAFSEENEPGVCPANSLLPIDGLEGSGRTTGCARVGEMALIFTLTQTWAVNWSSLPQFSSATAITNVYGCAAANSVVEGPGFAAWLSLRGPCIMSAGGGFQWLGDRVRDFWESLPRDDEGKVVCAGAAIDSRRKLVMWAVRLATGEEWVSADTDAKKSKLLCDRILVLNYATMAFSVIRRDGGRRVEAMGVGPVADGIDRIMVGLAPAGTTLSEFRPVYAMDGWVERGAAVSTFTVTARRDPSANTIAIASADQTIEEGDFLFVRAADGSKALYAGRASATAGASSVSVESADGAVWNANDVVVANGPRLRLKTQRLALWRTGAKGTIAGLAFHVTTDATYLYAKVRLIRDDGTELIVGDRWGTRIRQGATIIRTPGVSTDMAVEVEMFGDARFLIHSIVPEVEASVGV